MNCLHCESCRLIQTIPKHVSNFKRQVNQFKCCNLINLIILTSNIITRKWDNFAVIDRMASIYISVIKLACPQTRRISPEGRERERERESAFRKKKDTGGKGRNRSEDRIYNPWRLSIASFNRTRKKKVQENLVIYYSKWSQE